MRRNVSVNISEVIAKVVENPVVLDMTKRYKNQIAISGWVLRKPKFTVYDSNGVESCSLILFQFENTADVLKIQTYSCMVYEQEIVKQIKNMKNVFYIAGVGKLCYSKIVHGLYAHLMELDIPRELDIPLAPQWERKNERK